MNILVVSATQFEVASTFNKFSSQQFSEQLFFAGLLKQHKIYFLFTGVGMVATTFNLANVLNELRFDYIINAGIAGSICNLDIGDVVNVVDDFFYELGAEDNEKFLPIQEMNLLKLSDFPLNQKNILFNTNNKDNVIINTLKEAHGITVNKVHGNEQSIKQLKDSLQFESSLAYTESMEGAAIAYVAAKKNIHAIQLRSISNIVEPRNTTNWNIALAINNLNNLLYRYLLSL